MLPNVDFEDILFGECIYSCLIMGNTVVILPGLVGAGTLSPGVGSRALSGHETRHIFGHGSSQINRHRVMNMPSDEILRKH